MKKTLDVVKYENGYEIDITDYVIEFTDSDADRLAYEIVDDYFDAQEWVTNYDIIEVEDNKFIVKVNNDEEYNYTATVKQINEEEN